MRRISCANTVFVRELRYDDCGEKMITLRVVLIVFTDGYSYSTKMIISPQVYVFTVHAMSCVSCQKPHSDASGVRNKTRRQSAVQFHAHNASYMVIIRHTDKYMYIPPETWEGPTTTLRVFMHLPIIFAHFGLRRQSHHRCFH